MRSVVYDSFWPNSAWSSLGYLRSWTGESAADLDISQDAFTNICTKIIIIFNSVVMPDLANI